MKTNFLSPLFFVCVCISAYAQELQSPQINQNAIFANPGLAGSKGQTRVGTILNLVHNNYLSQWTSSNNSLISETYSYNKFYNGLVSADGLILKNKLGIGGYLKNEYYQKSYESWSYNGISADPNKNILSEFNYSNFYIGIMIAPKFYIHSTNAEKKGKTLSPAIGIGFKATQFNYSGTAIYTYKQDTIYKDGTRSKSMSLDYLSLGLLYSTPKSYWGLKCNFNQYNNTLLLYDISLVVARSYFNKTVANPKFSFNPQFYFALPIYQFNKHMHLWNSFEKQNMHNLSSVMCINIDFRYQKIIFGIFTDWTMNNGTYTGITGGVQLKNVKIVVNYLPKVTPKNNTINCLSLSANFLINKKKNAYRLTSISHHKKHCTKT